MKPSSYWTQQIADCATPHQIDLVIQECQLDAQITTFNELSARVLAQITQSAMPEEASAAFQPMNGDAQEVKEIPLECPHCNFVGIELYVAGICDACGLSKGIPTTIGMTTNPGTHPSPTSIGPRTLDPFSFDPIKAIARHEANKSAHNLKP